MSFLALGRHWSCGGRCRVRRKSISDIGSELSFVVDGWLSFRGGRGGLFSAISGRCLSGPAVALLALASGAEALAIVVAKIVFAIGDGNLLADIYVSDAENLHAIMPFGAELGVGIAVVICKACRTQKQRRRLLATGHDDAEIATEFFEIVLLLLGHGDLDPCEIFDGFTLADGLSGNSGCLVGDDCVAVGGGDLKGTVGKVNVDISLQMVLKVLLLVFGRQRTEIAGEPGQLQELLHGSGCVLSQDDMGLQDASDIFFSDAAGSRVTGAQLTNGGPIVDL